MEKVIYDAYQKVVDLGGRRVQSHDRTRSVVIIMKSEDIKPDKSEEGIELINGEIYDVYSTSLFAFIKGSSTGSKVVIW